MKLKLIDKKKEAGNVISFIFEPDKKITWTAGQYLIYSLEHKNKDLRGKQRFFTISSSPFEKNPVITTRIFAKDASSFKKNLNKLKIGEFIEAKGPDGDFIIDSMNKSYVFIAGGIGITPFISMLRELNHSKKTINITLLYSNKNTQVPFKGVLDEIAKRNSNLKISYIFSQQEIDKNLLRKYLGKKTIFYVSGPDPMVEEITGILKKIGVLKKNIKEDYFSGYKKI